MAMIFRPEALDELRRLLSERPMTAREIAAETGCSMPAVYRRIVELGRRGAKVKARAMKWRRVGPRPVAYRVIP